MKNLNLNFCCITGKLKEKLNIDQINGVAYAQFKNIFVWLKCMYVSMYNIYICTI